MNYSFRADVNGDNVINTADVFAVAGRLSDQLVIPSSLVFPPQFNFAVSSQPNEIQPLRVERGSENLSHPGEIEEKKDDNPLHAVDETFEDLYSDDSERKEKLDSVEYLNASDKLFETDFLDESKE